MKKSRIIGSCAAAAVFLMNGYTYASLPDCVIINGNAYNLRSFFNTNQNDQYLQDLDELFKNADQNNVYYSIKNINNGKITTLKDSTPLDSSALNSLTSNYPALLYHGDETSPLQKYKFDISQQDYLASNTNAQPVAKNVSVTGKLQVGETIQGNYTFYDEDNDLEGDSIYKWYRLKPGSSTPELISTSNSKTYTVLSQDEGYQIIFEVTPVSKTGVSQGATVKSDPSAAVQQDESQNSAPWITNLAIAGNLTVGSKVTAQYQYNDSEYDPEGATTFKWYRVDKDGNSTLIDNADLSYYYLTKDDYDYTIKVEVTPVAAKGTLVGSMQTVTTAAAVDVNNAPVVNNVKLSGTSHVGSKLSLTYDYSDIENDSEGKSIIKWYRVNHDTGVETEIVDNQNNKVYTITSDDLNSNIKAKVTPIAITGTTKGQEAESNQVFVDSINQGPTASSVTVNGVTAVGETLSGTYQYNDAENDQSGTTKYQWFYVENGNYIPISGENFSTYFVKAGDLGKNIVFGVIPVAATGTRINDKYKNTDGTYTKYELSDPTGSIQPNQKPAASNLLVSGVEDVGGTVKANFNYSDLENDQQGQSIYAWYRVDPTTGQAAAIEGANSMTYVVQQEDLNKKLRFTVIPVAQQGEKQGDQQTSQDSDVIKQNFAPQAANVKIDGQPYTGYTLTAKYDYVDVEGDPEGASTYKWFRYDPLTKQSTEIQGQITNKYTLQEVDNGKQIYVEITPVSNRGTALGIPTDSDKTLEISENNGPVASNVTILGQTSEDETLQGNYVYAAGQNEQEGISTYKWYRGKNADGSDKALITGACQKTYRLTSDDIGYKIFFSVIPSSISGHKGIEVISDATGDVSANQLPSVDNVNISGTCNVGATLNLSYSYNDTENDGQSGTIINWYRMLSNSNAQQINEAQNQTTYKLQDIDQGSTIFCEVIPGAANGATPGKLVRSTQTSVIGPNTPPQISNVVINGVADTGCYLTAGYSYYDAEGDQEAAPDYQWFRVADDGITLVPITDAKGQTYLLTQDDLNKNIVVEITPHAVSGVTTGNMQQSSPTETVLSNQVPRVENVNISGVVHIGEKVSGNYNYIDAENKPEGVTSYKWYTIDGNTKTLIDGENTNSYTIKAGDKNKQLLFEVTPVTQDGISGKTVDSELTEPVSDNQAPVVRDISIIGNTSVGSRLDVSYNYMDVENDPQGITQFQWGIVTNDVSGSDIFTPIKGETNNYYMIKQQDKGQNIAVQITPVSTIDPCVGTPEISLKTDAIQDNYPAYATNVSISGVNHVGAVLTGQYNYGDPENDAEGKSIYSWYAVDDNGNQTLLQTGTGSYNLTYQVKSADKGCKIVFKVTPVAGMDSVINPWSNTSNGEQKESEATAPIIDNSVPQVNNVNISGLLKQDETVTANYNYYDDENDSEDTNKTKFAWYRVTQDSQDPTKYNQTLISSATSKSYTLTSDDSNSRLRVEVTPYAESGNLLPGDAVSSLITDVIQPNDAPVASNLALTPLNSSKGDIEAGYRFRGDYVYTDTENDAEGNSIYQWYRKDSSGNVTPIDNATQNTYTVLKDDIGFYLGFKVIPVAVKGTITGQEAIIWSKDSVQINSAPVALNTKINGTIHVGCNISASYDFYDSSDVQGTAQFQWYIVDNGVETPIQGEITQNYIIKPQDLGKILRFKVTPTSIGGDPVGIASSCDSTVVLPNNPPKFINVAIKNKYDNGDPIPHVNSIIFGHAEYADDENDPQGTPLYQWYTEDLSGGFTPIQGATQQTYRITDQDVGKQIVFEATPVANAGYLKGAPVKSLPVTASNVNDAPVASNVVIKGDISDTPVLHVGAKLIGDFTYTDTESDEKNDAACMYQWYRVQNPSDPSQVPVKIPLATSKTYTIKDEDLGYHLIFGVIPVALSGTAQGVEKQSDPTEVITENTQPVAQNVFVNPVTGGGQYSVGETVQAIYSYYDAENDGQDLSNGPKYQWYRTSDGVNYTPIDGATAYQYILGQNDVGRTLKVGVTPYALSGNVIGDETMSSATDVVKQNIAPEARDLKICGVHLVDAIPHVGERIWLEFNYYDNEGDGEDGQHQIYQWYRVNPSTNSKQAITNANNYYYYVTDADLNCNLMYSIVPVAVSGTLTGTITYSYQTYPVEANTPPSVDGVPTIDITSPVVGQTITGNYSYIDQEEDQESYPPQEDGICTEFQWYRADSNGNNPVVIAGATDRSYKVTAADEGKTLIFGVIPCALTGSRNGIEHRSAATAAISSDKPEITDLHINGVTDVGVKVTAAYTWNYSPEGEGSSIYKWYICDSDGSNIDYLTVLPEDGCAPNQYLIKLADKQLFSSKPGRIFGVQVTPVSQGGVQGDSVTSSLTYSIGDNVPPVITNVRIIGVAHVGATLNVTGDWSDVEGDAAAPSIIKWYRTDSQGSKVEIISAENQSSYVVSANDKGCKISASMQPVETPIGLSQQNGDTVESDLTDTIIDNQPPTAVLNQSGVQICPGKKPNVGEQLSPSYSFTDPEGDAENGDPQTGTQYKWYRQKGTDSPVVIATTKEYVVQDADVGFSIYVEITPKDINGNAGLTVKSSSTQTVDQNHPPTIDNIIINGSLKVGQQLNIQEVNYNDTDGDGENGTIYKWYRVDPASGAVTEITEANNQPYYVLTNSDAGMKIRAEVTPCSMKGSLADVETGTMVQCTTSLTVSN